MKTNFLPNDTFQPMTKNGLSRRSFIALAATGVGGMMFLTKCGNPQRYSLFRFFTEEEATLAGAIADQIIPPDEWPGAKAAGVVNFIDKQLAGTYARYQNDYRNGLKAIATTCQTLYGAPFEAVSPDQQIELLTAMESGNLASMVTAKNPGDTQSKPWENGFDRTFFGLLCEHTMQGFYGSPRHGGNLNYISYKMVRLDYPLIIGQNRYNG